MLNYGQNICLCPDLLRIAQNNSNKIHKGVQKFIFATDNKWVKIWVVSLGVKDACRESLSRTTTKLIQICVFRNSLAVKYVLRVVDNVAAYEYINKES
jgi:hypothetical protein